MVITQIKKGKRGNSFLFLDGEYFTSIKTEILIKNGIKAGETIDEAKLEKIKQESDLFKAQQKALNLLSYRARSKKELKDRIKRETCETYADLTVKKMESLGLVNDKNFAKDYANELFLRKKISILGVKYKLKEKGISEEIIDQVLNDINVDEEKQALVFLQKRFSGKINDEKSKSKAINALNRLGYSWETIKRAMFTFEEEIKEDD